MQIECATPLSQKNCPEAVDQIATTVAAEAAQNPERPALEVVSGNDFSRKRRPVLERHEPCFSGIELKRQQILHFVAVA